MYWGKFKFKNTSSGYCRFVNGLLTESIRYEVGLVTLVFLKPCLWLHFRLLPCAHSTKLPKQQSVLNGLFSPGFCLAASIQAAPTLWLLELVWAVSSLTGKIQTRCMFWDNVLIRIQHQSQIRQKLLWHAVAINTGWWSEMYNIKRRSFLLSTISTIWAITVTIAITDYELYNSTNNSDTQSSIQAVHPIEFQLPRFNNRLNSAIAQFYSPKKQTLWWLLLHLVDKGDDLSAKL